MARTDQPTVRAHHDATTVSPRLTWSITAALNFAAFNACALVLPISGDAHGWPLVIGATVALFDQDAANLVDRLVAMLIDDFEGVCGHDASGRPS